MLMIRYELPAIEAEFPAPGATASLELLVKEPAPTLDVAGLRPVDVVALDAESSYRRYTGAGLLDVVVSLEEAPEGRPPPMGLFAALSAALLGGVGVLAYLRPRGSAEAPSVALPSGVAPATPTAPMPNEGRDGLILKVARLDESLDATIDPDKRRTLLEERTVLMARLRAQS
jgi:hypothetical protein